MKKTFITLVLVALSAISYGQTYKKVIVTKQGKSDTLLQVVETKTTTDTLSRQKLKWEIIRMEEAYKSGQESIVIQTKLNEFYLAEIARLKLLKKKTD